MKPSTPIKNSKQHSGRPISKRRPESAVKPKVPSQNHSSSCPYARKCGGCQLQGMAYAGQLRWKQEHVEKLLKKFHSVSPIIGMKDPLHYRNKVQAAFGYDRGRNIISGVYQTGTHQIVPVSSCMIEDQKADEIIQTILGMLKPFRLTAFDERTQQGFLRHVLVRRGFTSGEIMVVLVVGTTFFPSKKRFISALREKHPEITTLVTSLNPNFTSMVLGNREEVLFGPGYIEDTLCGCVFRISPRSFYQVNPVQTEKLYSTAIDFAHLTGTETVVDAYCGIGTIGMIAAKHAGQVIGIELNRDAVRDAIFNAKRNEMKNIRFICADAGEQMRRMASSGETADVVLMDPPRAGSNEEFLSSVCVLSPKRIVYISCNPQTQQRDLDYLTRHGYQVEQIQPVDMFPFTEHVETVVQLSQRKPDDVIRVGLDLDELDITSAESKATYPELKDYILNKYGFKVSSLYIAQVKRKLGLDVGTSFNQPKSENAKQPQCPPEKEAAIVEALKYFGMI